MTCEPQIYWIDAVPALPPEVSRRTLSQRAIALIDGLGDAMFTVEGFVSSANRDGVSDPRDLSIMLKFLIDGERIRRPVRVGPGGPAQWERCARGAIRPNGAA
jgi:hypothetical protein